MKKILALGCISAAGVVSALVTPLFIASAVPPAKPSPTPTPTPTPTVAPYTPAYEVVTADRTFAPGEAATLSATCPAGKSVTGGGYYSDHNGSYSVYVNYPDAPYRTWVVSARNEQDIYEIHATTYAVCANTQ